MRKSASILIFAFLAVCLSFSSCLKDKGTSATGATSLTGEWAMVNDSTTITPWGIWQGMPGTGTNYIGKASDYYHFTTNMVYYSENGYGDTATYAVKGNYVYFGYTNAYGRDTAVYQLSNLTAHTLTLKGDTAVSPEQVFSHIINLKK